MTNPSLISRTGPTQLKTLGRTQSSSTPLAVIRPPAVTARPLRRISRLVRLALTYALPLRPTPQLRRTRAYYRRDVIRMTPFRVAPAQYTHISTRSYPLGTAVALRGARGTLAVLYFTRIRVSQAAPPSAGPTYHLENLA